MGADGRPGPRPRPGRRATIREIADLAGVSIATVSRVVNDRDDVSPETREPRAEGHSRARLHREPQRPRRSRAAAPASSASSCRSSYPAYFSADPLGRRRGAARAGHAHRPLPDAAPARPRGLAARPADARHDRRRAARAARGVERRARRACSARATAFVVVDPLEPLARADSRGLGRARVGRRPGDRAPARARSPADRARSPAPRGWVATEERRRGYPRRARGGRASCPIPQLDGRGGLRDRRRRQGGRRPARPTRAADRDLRLQRQPRDRRASRRPAARGLRVPEDLSVVGFDDVEHATIVTPGADDVRQPLAEMGRMAVSLLLRLLDAAAVRDAARRAGDAPRRPRIDRAAAHALAAA